MRIGVDARLIRAYGIGSYVRGLLRALAGLGGDETYVAFVPSESRSLIPDSFETVTADVRPYSLQELLVMRRLVDRARLDLLHVPHFLLPVMTPGSCPIVCTLFDAIPFHHPLPNPIATAYIAWMMQRAADRSRRIITISHAAKRDLVEVLDCEPAKIRAIPIGVEEKFFGESGAASPGNRYFLFVGRRERHKNVEGLLDAFAMVRKRNRDVRLILAGGRHERFAGREGVDIPGFVSDEQLLALYGGAIAVVMPSLMEGFGLPPLEGMVLGTPAITSMDPALIEGTDDAALHVDARFPEALAEAMERLLHDEALRADLAARGRDRARTFTWQRCAEETRAVYREAMRQSHP